jgi:hypothetical protein
MPCYEQNSIPCTCTYSTAALNPDATVVLTKIGDDFPFRGIDGINGIVVTQNADTVFIDGANIGTGSLQTAYNGGNTIITANNLPVLVAGVGPLLDVRDPTPVGLFNITGIAPGNGLIQIGNESGLTFNNPVQLLAPTALDPFSNLRAVYPPTAISNLSTITSVPLVGGAVPANYAYTYTAPSTNTINHLRLHVVGNDVVNGSFSIESTVKFSPNGLTVIVPGSNNITSDPTLPSINIGYTSSGNQLNFVLLNPTLVTARVQAFLIATVLSY